MYKVIKFLLKIFVRKNKLFLFLYILCITSLTYFFPLTPLSTAKMSSKQPIEHIKNYDSQKRITIFFAGDVMTGRGIDQILPYPSKPGIHESYVKSAQGYVELMEKHSGAINKPAEYSYVWGDALDIFTKIKPDLKIVNLETSITTSEDYWKGKGINYRMSPANIEVLKTAGLDFVSLANNHVLDWGYDGLRETIEILDSAGIKHSGAGLDKSRAEKPAVFDIPNKGKVIIFSLGSIDSGIPHSWKATSGKPGVNLIDKFSETRINEIGKQIEEISKPEDLVVLSIHWGTNWGYSIPEEHRNFAHRLIDTAGVDIVHGHSSHHPGGVEVYKGKLVIYGAGDLINDYEGISGYENFRDDLSLMYFVTLNSTNVMDIRMVPMQIRKFSLMRAGKEDSNWLFNTMRKESNKLGTKVEINDRNILFVK